MSEPGDVNRRSGWLAMVAVVGALLAASVAFFFLTRDLGTLESYGACAGNDTVTVWAANGVESKATRGVFFVVPLPDATSGPEGLTTEVVSAVYATYGEASERMCTDTPSRSGGQVVSSVAIRAAGELEGSNRFGYPLSVRVVAEFVLFDDGRLVGPIDTGWVDVGYTG